MDYKQFYLNQVDLLLNILPVLNKSECFALKGGTAINLFIREMPRLSVDIDLTYLPIEPRDEFLKNIDIEISSLKNEVEQLGFKVDKSFNKLKQVTKLLVYSDDAVVKIEPNFIIRGTVYPSEMYDLCQTAQDQFAKYTRTKLVSFADLYAGKLCAALDRYHPRDLFDVKHLLENHGLNDQLRKAFIVYLASTNRPMHELLNPEWEPDENQFNKIYNNEFIGMADSTIEPDILLKIRRDLPEVILRELLANEKQFLITFKAGEPDWTLLDIENAQYLPAVQWKLANIRKIPSEKRTELLDNLKRILEGS